MNDKDRIMLAEAMGYESCPPSDTNYECYTWVHKGKLYPQWDLPDPFTDANDDYAVLEWAIKNLEPDTYQEALIRVCGTYAYLWEYRIGYFSTAAVAVLREQK